MLLYRGVRCDFRMGATIGSSLPLVLCGKAHLRQFVLPPYLLQYLRVCLTGTYY
jgi:hypothetical protein